IAGHELPIYIANFVLMEYGTGAIFACPAHDQRDMDFARKYNLAVIPVVAPKEIAGTADEAAFIKELGENGGEAFADDGVAVNSDFLNGLSVNDGKKAAIEKLKSLGVGEGTVQYRLRDWGVSRQRYWGCPIPIIRCETCGEVPVPESDLPVALPDDVDFSVPGNPLAAHQTWKHVNCPKCGKDAVRETDTFDTFFESSWYFARFASPRADGAFDKAEAEYWLPVDQYIGGIEHAVLHLLYSRFFTRALKDCGYIDLKEPFAGLMTQGMICHETYQDNDGKWLTPTEALNMNADDYKVGRSEKMSKSKKNVVDPEKIIGEFGADTARLFMLSDSPPDRDLDWTDSGIEGAWRYVGRLWRLINENISALPPAGSSVADDIGDDGLNLRRQIHKTIFAVGKDLDAFHFNKAVARIRELTNALEAETKKGGSNMGAVLREGFEVVAKLINPMMPHLAEELWQTMGHKTMLADEPWPKAIDSLLIDDTVTIAVQVMGKLRATLELPKDCDSKTAEEAALKIENVVAAMNGKPAKKVVVVPNRIINVVI
ncbi:MAG: leucine--tRNA ligase, partial [Rhodospirillaceae bacterium]|nr:leucine--tRNA ligase [Rhodospirillaceae bacterium]